MAFTRNRHRQDLDADLKLRLALSYVVLGMGRAAGRVPADVRSEQSHIPWDDLDTLERRVSDPDGSVDLDTLWTSAVHKAPLVAVATQRLMDHLEASSAGGGTTQPAAEDLSHAVALIQERLGHSREQIAEFCGRNQIVRLSLFGSVLRTDFDPDSDVDVLIEFEPGSSPGLRFFGLGDELGDILGRKVDVLTPESLHARITDRVLAETYTFYSISDSL